LAHRRILRQVDDALVIIGQLQLEGRDQHAATLDAADGADAEGDVLAWDEGAGGREYALHAGARVGRAAHHLHRFADAGIDHAYAQAVGIRVLFGRHDASDRVVGERLRLVLDAFDFEADARQRLDDPLEGGVGVEVVLEPGESEFHDVSPPARVGKSSGRKP
jgi:hypothetical protein